MILVIINVYLRNKQDKNYIFPLDRAYRPTYLE